MKLTWFGSTATRVQIGGKILVCDPETAAQTVNRTELVSGADRVFMLDGTLPPADTLVWKPRRPPALIDEGEAPEVMVHGAGGKSALIDAVGEPPLLILKSPLTSAGRWKSDAVVVAFERSAAIKTQSSLEPRILVLAMPEPDVEGTIGVLRDKLGGTSLMVLEPGFALEV